MTATRSATDPRGTNEGLADRSGLISTLLPIWRGRRVVIVAGFVVAVVIGLLVLVTPRRFRADISLVTVGNSRLGALGGNLAAAAGLLGGGLGGASGLQATPAIVVKFADLDGVLNTVARTRVPGTNTTIIERATKKTLDDIEPFNYTRILRRYVSASFDRTTGVIDITVVHEDSALARQLATTIVDVTQRTFMRAARAQATELRQAQAQRVDSAHRQLTRAEDQLLSFTRANRQFEPYSEMSVLRARLERDVTLAQTVYTQAINDRESAVAKELDDSPMVLVIDPLPDRLVPISRHTVIVAGAAGLTGAVIAILLLLLRQSLQDQAAAGRQESQRALDGLRRIPVAGRFFAQRSGEAQPLRADRSEVRDGSIRS